MQPPFIRQLSIWATGLVPYVASLLLLRLPVPRELVPLYVERYFAFVLLFIIWSLTCRVLLHHVNRSQKGNFYLLIFVAGAVLSLFSLQYLKEKCGDVFFYLALIAMGQQGLAERMLQNKWLGLHALAKFIFYALVAYMTFLVGTPVFQWQDILFSLGIATAVSSVPLAQALITHETAPTKKKKSKPQALPKEPAPQAAARAYALSLFLAPSLVVILAFFGHLPRVYYLCYLPLPIWNKLIERAKTQSQTSAENATFTYESSLNCWLFMAIIIFVSLVN